jgi:2-aminoadipate transaminase
MARATTAPASDKLDTLFSKRARAAPPKPILDSSNDVVNRISFVYGFPDGDSLPAAAVAEATHRVMERDGRWALQYGNNVGYAGLIDVLLQKLKRDQGIDAGPENIIITAGGSQALDLVLDAFVNWDDTIISEMPTWLGAVQAFNNVGAEVVSVPVDDEGTDTAALERELKRLRDAGIVPKLIYVISNFQNPSGISTSLDRRRHIVALAQEFQTLILEDDAYFDLRYSADYIPPIYTLDASSSTMYMGTLSKTMGAGMRLGWLVADPAIIQRLAALKVDGGTNVFGSHVAADWLPRHQPEHVSKLRAIYQRRRDLMLAALERHMPEGTTWTRPDGGFFIWVTLPEAIDTGRMLAQARERGVDYLPGHTCFTDGSGRNQLRLAYSYATDEQIEPGVRIIGEIAKGELLESARS